MNTEAIIARKEIKMMNEVSGEALISEEKALRRALNTAARCLLVWFGALPVVFTLASLAYANAVLFELVANLVWNGAFVFMSWVSSSHELPGASMSSAELP